MSGPDGSRFANHCPHCGTEQDDRDLHTEPSEPFFDIPHAPPGMIRLSLRAGPLRLPSGLLGSQDGQRLSKNRGIHLVFRTLALLRQ